MGIIPRRNRVLVTLWWIPYIYWWILGLLWFIHNKWKNVGGFTTLSFLFFCVPLGLLRWSFFVHGLKYIWKIYNPNSDGNIGIRVADIDKYHELCTTPDSILVNDNIINGSSEIDDDIDSLDDELSNNAIGNDNIDSLFEFDVNYYNNFGLYSGPEGIGNEMYDPEND